MTFKRLPRRRFLRLLAASMLPFPRLAKGTTPPHVLVVGGGPAGISAALELAQRGVKVTLLEATDRLGGKVEGWTEDLQGDQVDVEHGIHGCAGGYVHFTELLERCGLGDALRRPDLWENGVRFGSEEGSLRPWENNVIIKHAKRRAKEMGYGSFWPEYARGQRFLKALTREEARRRWGGMSVAERYETQDPPLTGYGLFPGMYARSLYFVEPEELDAGVYAISERFNRYDVRWMRGNPQTLLWDPLEKILRDLGVDVRLGTRVSQLRRRGGRVVGARAGRRRALGSVPAPPEGKSEVTIDGLPVFFDRSEGALVARSGACTHAGCPVARSPEGFACPCHGGRYNSEGVPVAGPPKRPLARLHVREEGGLAHLSLPEPAEDFDADAVILAVDAPAFAKLAGPAIPAVSGLKGCRHTVARYWFDRDVERSARVAIVIHGAKHASNGILIHRTQDRSRAWAEKTGGSVIEIQAFRDIPRGASEETLLDLIEADVRSIWPELSDAGVLHRTLAQGERFTWFFPGWHEHSTPVVTEVPGLLAAGDFVLIDRDCEFMERSVLTGRLAANAVLREHRLPTAPILPPLR